MVLSTQSLPASAVAILARPIDDDFTLEEIQTMRAIASASPARPRAASDSYIQKSLATLASIKPMAKRAGISGELMRKAYITALQGFPEGAVDHTCRHFQNQKGFFPEIAELIPILTSWRSPEQIAIDKAKSILRKGPGRPRNDAPLSHDEIARMSPDMIALGIKIGSLVERDGVIYDNPDPPPSGSKKESETDLFRQGASQ